MRVRRGVVLCYHAVSADWSHRLALPPAQLLRQVRTARRLCGHVHVTFDDAYRSILDVVPELLRQAVPVSVFVCTDFADRGGAPLDVPELAPADERDLAGLATLSWDELRNLASHGVEIGSHTVTHPHLPGLGDDELAQELRDSKRRIETELGEPCRRLAYPYGEHDLRVRSAAREAGYEEAFALRAASGDRFALPRVDLYRRDTALRAALKTSVLHRPMTAGIESLSR